MHAAVHMSAYVSGYPGSRHNAHACMHTEPGRATAAAFVSKFSMGLFALQDASRALQDMQLDAAGMKRRIVELLDSQVTHVLCKAAFTHSRHCCLCLARPSVHKEYGRLP